MSLVQSLARRLLSPRPRPASLEVDGLIYELRWSARRRTVEIGVDRHGRLRIAAPEGCPLAFLEGFAREKRSWVEGRLARRAAPAPPVPREFVDGELFPVFGRLHPLRLVDVARPPLALDERGFRLSRAAHGRAREQFERWYRARCAAWIEDRIAALAPVVGRSPSLVAVREMGRRWGSCAHDGRLAFNWRLALLPPELGDYVVVHELAHLVEHNHGREFWRQVERVLPDHRERRSALARQAVEHAWAWR